MDYSVDPRELAALLIANDPRKGRGYNANWPVTPGTYPHEQRFPPGPPQAAPTAGTAAPAAAPQRAAAPAAAPSSTGAADPALLAALRGQQAPEDVGDRERAFAMMAALSGAQTLQPFAQVMGQAGDSRLRMAMQKRQQDMQRAEHEEARKTRQAERDEDRAWRTHENRLNREAMMSRRMVGQEGVGQPILPGQAEALRKIGVDPAGLRDADEAAKVLTNPRAYGIQLAQDKFAHEKEQRDELTPAQQEGVAEYDNAIALIDKIILEKKSVNTGPVAAARSTRLAKTLGLADPKVAGFRSDIDDTLATYIRSISGKAASDKERGFLENILPSVRDQDATFDEMAKRARERLELAKNERLSTYRLSGRNTKNLETTGGTMGTPLQGNTAPSSGGAGGGDDLSDILKLYGVSK